MTEDSWVKGDIVVARYNYQAAAPDELSLTKGQRVLVLEAYHRKGWWNGKTVDGSGLFPGNYCRKSSLALKKKAERDAAARSPVATASPSSSSPASSSSSHTSPSSTSSSSTTTWRSSVPTIASAEGGGSSSQRNSAASEQRLRAISRCVTAVALYPYEAQDPVELTLAIGDTVEYVDIDETRWVFGRRNGDPKDSGWFPAWVIEDDEEDLEKPALSSGVAALASQRRSTLTSGMHRTSNRRGQSSSSSTQGKKDGEGEDVVEEGETQLPRVSSALREWMAQRPTKEEVSRRGIFRRKVDKPLFYGLELEELYVRCNKRPLPQPVTDLIHLLDRDPVLKLEGLFRVTGNVTTVQMVQDSWKVGSNFPLAKHVGNSPHDVATLLKRFFDALPSPLIPYSFMDECCSSVVPGPDPSALPEAEQANNHVDPEALLSTLRKLSPIRTAVLHYLCGFLHKVTLHS